MNTITIKTQHIVGISVRTTNENGQAAKDIEALWQQFRNEDIQHQIPNKISDDIYAVYTDYESDFTRPYTTVIGLPVSTLGNIPEGMTGITIETDVYQQFTSKGKMPEAVVNTWLDIWSDKVFNQKRAYHTDFTVHGKKYHDGDQAEVETFISLKRK